jgi:hypothetical protein
MLITRQFYQWLIEMQQRPSDYGIPSEHHKDVQAIFSAFLGRSNENVHIWRTVLDTMTATERQADPVTVHFGPNLEPLEIVDGPSALEYLFIIAELRLVLTGNRTGYHFCYASASACIWHLLSTPRTPARLGSQFQSWPISCTSLRRCS